MSDSQDSQIPLAQLVQQEVAEAVQQTNARMYQEHQYDGIQALDRTDLLTFIAQIQKQLIMMQQQMQEQQANLAAVSDHQQEVDQQTDQLLSALQQSPIAPQQTVLPTAPTMQIVPQTVPVAPRYIVHADQPRVDSAKPPAAFRGTSHQEIESWVFAMGLYFAVNESLTNNQKAVRIALNLSGTAQKQFHNIMDVPLDQLTLAAIESELITQ